MLRLKKTTRRQPFEIPAYVGDDASNKAAHFNALVLHR